MSQHIGLHALRYATLFLMFFSLFSNASSLRYFRANGRVEYFMRFSEAYFWHNSHVHMMLTPIFLVAIFLLLRIGAA